MDTPYMCEHGYILDKCMWRDCVNNPNRDSDPTHHLPDSDFQTEQLSDHEILLLIMVHLRNLYRAVEELRPLLEKTAEVGEVFAQFGMMMGQQPPTSLEGVNLLGS